MENCEREMEWQVSLKIMVYYYDMDKYKQVPPVSDQEYSTVNLIREMLPENNL